MHPPLISSEYPFKLLTSLLLHFYDRRERERGKSIIKLKIDFALIVIETGEIYYSLKWI
jgi:hypothetical protein